MKDIFAKHGLNCPVTHGLATRMSAASFAEACTAKRTQGEPSAVSDGVLFFKICQICNANHQPEELEIVDMPKTIGAGACDCCGNDSNTLRKGYDQQLCASCYTIHTHANGRAELVLDVITKLQGQEYIAKYLGDPVPPQDNCAELEATVFTLREEVERLRRDTDTPAPASCPQASRLLDLALDVIRGKITGLSADQIETLRGIS